MVVLSCVVVENQKKPPTSHLDLLVGLHGGVELHGDGGEPEKRVTWTCQW